MNRALLLKHLITIATRLAAIRLDPPFPFVLPSRPLLRELLAGTFKLVGNDPEICTALGWLSGVAGALLWSDIPTLLTAAEITSDDLAAIERGEYTEPREAPGAADKIYKSIKASIATVLRDRLSRVETIVIRSAEAPVIDEFSRAAAQCVVLEFGLA